VSRYRGRTRATGTDLAGSHDQAIAGRDTKDVEMTIKILLLMALVSAIAASSYFRGSADLSEQENP
jgi:hypothetical protein